MQRYVAIDFETANPKRNSACQIGICIIEDNKITGHYEYLINPEVPFTENCIRVHGIMAKDVQDKPTFPQIYNMLKPHFDDAVFIAHNASFDKYVLYATADRYHIALPNYTFVCTLKMSECFDFENYKLNTLCKKFNISLLKHHSAGDDALACAKVFLYMEQLQIKKQYIDTPLNVKPPKARKFYNLPPVYKTIELDYYKIDSLTEFDSMKFVITGEIGEFKRNEIESILKRFGGILSGSVTKVTKFVIVGKENILATKDSGGKSRKIITAETLISQGYDIKFIDGEQIKELIENETTKV